jgi:hypothetical protein
MSMKKCHNWIHVGPQYRNFIATYGDDYLKSSNAQFWILKVPCKIPMSYFETGCGG